LISKSAGAAVVAVVVASNRTEELLRACLDSLVPQCEANSASLIVSRADDGVVASLRGEYPDVRWITASPGDDIPRLRGRGLDASRATLTALTEDHCVPAPDWLSRVRLHSDDVLDVIGGGMDNLRPRAIDWGAYFSEYGFFDASRPDTAGAADGFPLLTGANVTYRSTVRETVAASMLAGDWENTVHRRLAERGHKLAFDRTMRVAQNKTYGFVAFCSDRFEHGLDYARTRTSDSSLAARALRAALTPALPLVLTWRVGVAAGRAHAGAFARALPVTVAFLSAWSVGEAVGYLRGGSSR
jgi:hypothetical protein